MIIIKVMGGLGNQLQQYALCEKFKSLGKDARLDTGWYQKNQNASAPRSLELALFEGLTYAVCTDAQREALLGKDGSLSAKAARRIFPAKSKWYGENGRMYLPEIFDLENAYLEGYWACEKYYHTIIPALQQQIKFPQSLLPANREASKQIIRENAISVHIRRGDYLSPENADLFSGICTERYYKAAMEWMRKQVGHPRFYIFSDDAAYAKKHYCQADETVVDWNSGADSFYDMYLMSLCKHNICANSTFSFWGARLNRNPVKKVIRPLKHRNNQTYLAAVMHELWEDFLFMDEEGRFV